MEPIYNLLEWAVPQGVQLKHIGAKPLPGRGIGMVALNDIKANTHILTIPSSVCKTLENIPETLIQALKGATVHAILATALLNDTSREATLWQAVFPSRHDVTASMPMCWPASLQKLLPETASRMLRAQQVKFTADWDVVSAACPEMDVDDFRVAWLLVNSRSFYHKTRRTAKLPAADHMVLQPVADLFNHSPDGCSASFDEGGDAAFTVVTSRSLAAGDEIFLCYGSHANDLLLVEYGFTLPLSLNPWDEICLDSALCPRFSETQQQALEDVGFWGGYMLDADTACYRTQIALRVLCLPSGRWKEVLDGQRDENEDQDVVDAELVRVLRSLEKEARGKMAEVDRSSAGDTQMRDGLRARWAQIKELIVLSISRLQD